VTGRPPPASDGASPNLKRWMEAHLIVLSSTQIFRSRMSSNFVVLVSLSKQLNLLRKFFQMRKSNPKISANTLSSQMINIRFHNLRTEAQKNFHLAIQEYRESDKPTGRRNKLNELLQLTCFVG
jgi:hypothetical protein